MSYPCNKIMSLEAKGEKQLSLDRHQLGTHRTCSVITVVKDLGIVPVKVLLLSRLFPCRQFIEQTLLGFIIIIEKQTMNKAKIQSVRQPILLQDLGPQCISCFLTPSLTCGPIPAHGQTCKQTTTIGLFWTYMWAR